MYKAKELKKVSSFESDRKLHPYYSRLSALIGKKIVVTFNDHDLEGVLLGYDSNHLNLCLQVNGKLVFVRGNAFLSFEEV